MEYLHSQNVEAFKKEYVRIACQVKRVQKHPEKGLINTMAMNIVMLCICGLYVGSTIPYLIQYPNLLLGLVTGAMAILGLKFLYNIILTVRFGKAFKTGSRGEMDADGFTLVREAGTNKLNWNAMKCIRVFKYVMVFVPKESNVLMLCIPVENRENVEAFMQANGIDVKIIE
jgi:hypothetical protein